MLELVFENCLERKSVYTNVVNAFSDELNWSTSSMTITLWSLWRCLVASLYSNASASVNFLPVGWGGLALPLSALATRSESSSSSTDYRFRRSTAIPVFFSVTSWRRLREKLRTSVNVIALYMYSWNSLTLPSQEALRSYCKTWLREEVFPVPGWPHRYMRPDVPLRRLLDRNLPMIRCSFSLV